MATKTEYLSARVEAELKRAVQDKATRDERSISELIVFALRGYIYGDEVPGAASTNNNSHPAR